MSVRQWAAVAMPLLGCAVGSDGGEAPAPMIPNTSAGTTSVDDDDGETGAASESGGDDVDTTTGPPPATSSGGSSAEDTGGTTTGGAESTGTTGGGQMCADVGMCNNAMVLGSVSGDTSSDPLELTGSQPLWVTFQVTEDNDDAAGEDMRFTATLNSPPGYDFDLYAFRGAKGSGNGCGGVTDESTGTGELDIVSMSWGEGAIANGDDDTAWVAVQIQVKGGLCDPTAEWTLTVEGD